MMMIDFLFDFNRNYVSIFYRFRDIAGYLSKVAGFDPPHLHLAPPEGAIPVEFCGDLWHQKTRVPGLSCAVVCVILRLAVLVEHRLVTDGQGSVATYYTRCGGIFNIHLTANLLRNLPAKKIINRLRFDKIVIMSLWPRFLAYPEGLHVFVSRVYSVCLV